jgi:hypothetical protein
MHIINGNGVNKVYASTNFHTKKAFREAVEAGKEITLFAPGLGTPKVNGTDYVEGPWYPEAHKWWAEVTMKDGKVVKVR